MCGSYRGTVATIAKVSHAPGANESRLLAGVRERFVESTDFTVGLEEEYQLLDPTTLALTNRFEELKGAASGDFAERLAGELIASEIEFRTGKNDTFAAAVRELAHGRLQTIALADELQIALGASGVHPFSTWPDQRLIDTPHYRLLDQTLGYVAWTNNTWSIHLHCGVRDPDRAMAVATAMRSVLPELLALSANSPIFWGRATRLHSTRTQVFMRSFPRCGIPDPFTNWDDYASFVGLLERTGSIQEATQIWWSIRPHHSYGTLEVRICDGQTEMSHAVGVMALAFATIARFCAAYDAGEPLPVHSHGLLEENLWRAIRYGLEGEMIDLDRGVVRPTVAAVDGLLQWVEPVVDRLGLAPFLEHVPAMLSHGNGAQVQLRLLDELGDPKAVHSRVVARTRASAQEFLETLPVSEVSR